MVSRAERPRDLSVGAPRGVTSIALPCIALVLLAARFYNFRPFLDEPHAFRQAWTSYYALEFFRFDMNILRPSIISMGDFRHVLIEFPLPEWLTAVFYHVTGATLYVDRLVAVTCFVGSAYFLHRCVTLVQDRLLAWMGVIIYMAAPLGVYFSRSVTIDTAALFCGHALLFFFLRYGESGRRSDLCCASVAATLGLLIKAPYVFFLAVPLLAVQAARRRWARALVISSVFGASLVPGLAWYVYAQMVSGGAPDLGFIRGFEAPVISPEFFVGAATRRLDLVEWRTLLARAGGELGPYGWWMLLALAVFARRLDAAWFASTWLCGAALFVIVFFAANVMHNYYQLAVMAPCALLAAMPLYRWMTGAGGRPWRHWAVVALLGVYAVAGTWTATQRFYQVDRLGIDVGRFVNELTTERDLVIMAFNDADSLDPRYLYYADRRGWSIRAQLLEPEAIDGLRQLGATAIVTSDIWSAPAHTVARMGELPLAGVFPVGDQQVFLHRIN